MHGQVRYEDTSHAQNWNVLRCRCIITCRVRMYKNGTRRGVSFTRFLTIMKLFWALFYAAFATAGTLHTRSYFYVGQTYNTTAPSAVAHGQMYVEHLTPANVTQPYPLVFIHGREMTGTNILATIDGEQSWADYFLAQGYEVEPRIITVLWSS